MEQEAQVNARVQEQLQVVAGGAPAEYAGG